MKIFLLALKMLRRNWRAGEARVLIAGLFVAVASVTTVGFFADRVEGALNRQANELIAADATQGIGHPTYIADKRRDLELSRTAGIDAALCIGDVDVLIAPMGAAAKCTGKAGAPTLAIPIGLSPDGTPFGITVYARWGDDQAVLDAGALIEAHIGDRRLPALAFTEKEIGK